MPSHSILRSFQEKEEAKAETIIMTEAETGQRVETNLEDYYTEADPSLDKTLGENFLRMKFGKF